MTKRQKSSLKFFTETETNKTLKLKIFYSVFLKTEKCKNTEKKTEKKTYKWKSN
jgi:hypothetical protein